MSPQETGVWGEASFDAGLSLGFCSSLQHCGGKYSVHTPSWPGSIPLSFPSHEQYIENASTQAKTIERYAENLILQPI